MCSTALTGLNVTFCQEDLKQVYHQVFNEALAAYNAKKRKTRDKIPDYVPDTAPARHAGDRHAHRDHRPSSSRFERERHFGSDVAHVFHVIPGRSMQPLCYFLGEKVHTAAPLERQYKSAFARSRGERTRHSLTTFQNGNSRPFRTAVPVFHILRCSNKGRNHSPQDKLPPVTLKSLEEWFFT